MEKILVKGGAKLEGKVRVEGAKNAALPILAATILPTKGQTKLLNVPILADIFNMEKVLNELGLATDFDQEKESLTVESSDYPNSLTPYDLMNKMRASTLVMGPLLARNGEAKVAMPGGCAIGQRPIDLHLKGFEAMGAEIQLTEGYIVAKTPNGLKGAEFYMDFPSVGATENIMMAATLAEGTTILRNVAKEPEIVDLANFLNKMGAKVQGAGTNTITIHGVDELVGTEYPIVADRIVAGTFLVAAAITQGDVVIENFIAEHNRPLIAKMREMGATIQEYENDTIHVKGPEVLQAVDVETQPYPGFPTDMQSVMTVAQLLANGTSIMKETVFENRFMHLNELARMNANYEIDGQSAIIYGGKELHGAEVMSTDLRAAAALILAGLATGKGITRVGGLEHLDRGYYQFTEKLQDLGANILRVDDDKAAEAESQIEALKEK